MFEIPFLLYDLTEFQKHDVIYALLESEAKYELKTVLLFLNIPLDLIW